MDFALDLVHDGECMLGLILVERFPLLGPQPADGEEIEDARKFPLVHLLQDRRRHQVRVNHMMEKFPSRYLFHSCEKAFRAVEIVRNLGISKVKK